MLNNFFICGNIFFTNYNNNIKFTHNKNKDYIIQQICSTIILYSREFDNNCVNPSKRLENRGGYYKIKKRIGVCRMRRKSAIIIAIILMSIGFAAVSTTLVINGNANVSENEEDFSVIFTAASIDGKDVYSSVIDDTKKIITFETSELKTLNQTSILTYEVTNNSSNYDANVTVTCVPKEGTTAKYTSIKNKLANDTTVVKAKETINGTLTVTLNKTAIEEVSEEYSCKLEFNAVERDTIAIGGPYYAFGIPTTASTTDYTTLSNKVFAKLGTDNLMSVCIYDGELICIRTNDYDNSILVLKSHFGEASCSTYVSSFSCSSVAFNCSAHSNGLVSCSNSSTGDDCHVYSDGFVTCN